MKRRALILGSLALSASLLLSACGGSAASSQAASASSEAVASSAAASSEASGINTTGSGKRYDRKYTILVITVESIKHIPHDITVNRSITHMCHHSFGKRPIGM